MSFVPPSRGSVLGLCQPRVPAPQPVAKWQPVHPPQLCVEDAIQWPTARHGQSRILSFLLSGLLAVGACPCHLVRLTLSHRQPRKRRTTGMSTRLHSTSGEGSTTVLFHILPFFRSAALYSSSVDSFLSLPLSQSFLVYHSLFAYVQSACFPLGTMYLRFACTAIGVRLARVQAAERSLPFCSLPTPAFRKATACFRSRAAPATVEA